MIVETVNIGSEGKVLGVVVIEMLHRLMYLDL